MECLRRYLWVLAILVTVLVSTANCYTITVDAHEEQCFFEHVDADTKMGKPICSLRTIFYGNELN